MYLCIPQQSRFILCFWGRDSESGKSRTPPTRLAPCQSVRKTRPRATTTPPWRLLPGLRRRKTQQQKQHGNSLSYPLITKHHRAYIQRTVKVSEAFWEGTAPKPTDTYHLCIVVQHDPAHTFERVRNVHRKFQWPMCVRAGARFFWEYARAEKILGT